MIIFYSPAIKDRMFSLYNVYLYPNQIVHFPQHAHRSLMHLIIGLSICVYLSLAACILLTMCHWFSLSLYNGLITLVHPIPLDNISHYSMAYTCPVNM